MQIGRLIKPVYYMIYKSGFGMIKFDHIGGMVYSLFINQGLVGFILVK